MENAIKNAFIWTFTFALGLLLVSTVFAGPHRSDFALLDEEPGAGDTSVQCGATKASANNPKPAAFTMYITMTNRGDLGGVDGFVRVTYRDHDFVDYAIPANTTVQITLAGGGTPGVDDIIKVSGDGPGGSVLIGQASIILHADGKPPLATGTGGKAFCTTSPASPAPF